MIVVVADDLSGAAELAGAALSHGLSAEVHRLFIRESRSQVVCLDTDSRLLLPRDAVTRVRTAMESVTKRSPSWIYKKTDSVLRGHVASELGSILSLTGQSRAMLAPANPSKQRVIKDGHYFIGDTPLHETVFAKDPEYPRRTSRVEELLNLPPAFGVTDANIVIPDVTSREDLERLAGDLNDRTLPAGGVEFFQSILRHRGFPLLRRSIVEDRCPASHRRLLVCGSAAAWANGRRDQCESRCIPIQTMPIPLFALSSSHAAVQDWAHSTVNSLNQSGCVMVAIGEHDTPLPFAPHELVNRLAAMLEAVLSEVHVDRIYLEGGATASALLRQMNWERLIAQSAGENNLAGFKVNERPQLEMFIKPGSYDWPDSAWPSP